MNKFVFPEVIGWILDQVNECDKQPPGMGPIDYQSL